MASIIYQVNKKTGAKYAFESVSYWDKEKKQPRSKRKYLGKVDPETGTIIPSRGKTVSTNGTGSQAVDISKLYEEIRVRDRIIEGLRKELDELQGKYNELSAALQKIYAVTEAFKDV